MNNSIHRQHENTTLPELDGQVCERFLAVYNTLEMTYSVFYLKLSGVFHRFYLDAGLLFWRSDEEPDSENDLLEKDVYIDVGETYGLYGLKVAGISMTELCATLQFGEKTIIYLKGEVDRALARLSVNSISN